ncbi:hypothetical protein V7793_37980, partial [Streptomyces sp. KLMMK]|uniref:hypothetical protein n=1 Tax=Streptomyces sp. KLMMK TaxID=3109353 RepID=UPI00300877FF
RQGKINTPQSFSIYEYPIPKSVTVDAFKVVGLPFRPRVRAENSEGPAKGAAVRFEIPITASARFIVDGEESRFAWAQTDSNGHVALPAMQSWASEWIDISVTTGIQGGPETIWQVKANPATNS